MSVHRIMGIETEYGISVAGQPSMNAMVASSHIVNSYASLVGAVGATRPRWDYELEAPLRDARGFDVSRADADPSQLTDEDLGLANVILTNGARLYVDHAHPEYSSPEVTNPRDALIWDRAGAVIMHRAAQLARAATGMQFLLYKNNTDNKGVSYGCHENYLMRRETPFTSIATALIPFFITRQVFTGAGRLGRGQDGSGVGFQLSQRADFFEVEVGLETTLKRPIINTRDEPHADPERYRRLHVIVGDANLSDTATYLKMGSTAIVLSMIEANVPEILDLMPAKPVLEMHAVSHDYDLRHRLTLERGRSFTALEMQQAFLEAAWRHCEGPLGIDNQTKDVLVLWERTLSQLAGDRSAAASTVDWCAKLALMEGYRRRDGLSWTDPRLALIDLQYSDMRPEKGLAYQLERRGSLLRVTSDEEVSSAVEAPPRDTRAFFRGECMRRYPDNIAAAAWDSVVFDLPEAETLLRVPTMEPTRGTAAHVEHLLDRASTAGALVRLLQGEEADSDQSH
jgi:proteasome accessory factor A